jgi:hypothetical protein
MLFLSVSIRYGWSKRTQNVGVSARSCWVGLLSTGACMAGMIMCLDGEQRLTYIIGDVFEADHNLGAEIFEITPANFRQKLTCARKD